MRFSHRSLATVLLLTAAVPARAVIFTVGADAGVCSYTTIQAAVNAAAGNGVPDTIRITRTQSYVAQQVVVNTGEDLSIVGGFANCTSTASDGTQTTVSGAGGDTLPVFDLRSPTDSTIRFRLLRITAGDQDGAGSGGGINYVGVGRVELIETTVDGNRAAFGGGVYFRGEGNNAELLISNDVLVSGNEATNSGGGIYLHNGDMTMNAPRSSIAFNTAAQFGGGILMLGAGPVTSAVIGTGGLPGIAAIHGNEAAYGGGVSLNSPQDGNTEAVFDLVTVDAGAPATLSDNFASQRGGAIYLQPYKGVDERGDVRATASGAVIEDNSAPDGAAVYASTDTNVVPYGGVFFMGGGRLAGNRALTAGGVATDGPLIVAGGRADASLSRVRVQGNDTGPVLHARNARFLDVLDSLITGNVVRGPVLEVFEGSFRLNVTGTTIAGNTLSADPVIYSQEQIFMRRMLVWQPGRVTLDAGDPDVDGIFASEVASLPPGSVFATGAPRFLDPARGDYGLQAASPAVDLSELVDGAGIDGLGRGVDIERVANRQGIGDAGAYERQALGNLVLNPGFLADLNLWNAGTAGSSVTRDAFGAGGSLGAITASMQSAPGGEFVALTQCVRMPGPGFWRVSGFAFAPGGDALTRDRVSMRWRLIYDTGDENCGGALGTEGNIAFPNGTTWAKREEVFTVDPARFTPRTAVEVQLRVREGSFNVNATTTGHFDGIVVETSEIPPSALPFRNGFE